MNTLKSKLTYLLIMYSVVGILFACNNKASDRSAGVRSSSYPNGYAGSKSCRKCHEKFYVLWSRSYHGLAMQPYNADFAKRKLTPQCKNILIGTKKYRAEIEKEDGYVIEKVLDGKKKYSIKHVMGGKNVYYFLTPLDRGHLQVLPVAYNVRSKQWFDTVASGLRHFSGQRDEALDWKDPWYTFNTSCYSCHVSQLATNYDLETDTYHTVWAEPGINCEECHGPAEEHNRVCEEAPEGQVPEDLKIISAKNFTPEQHNEACSPCHAKMRPLSATFRPGERFFDYYDLITLEHPDFYPDGRDLGENYTYTLWLTSPCLQSEKLHCLHCHTSSGRYRFEGATANDACMPCHQEHVIKSTAHTHHKSDSAGNKCISCHMPKTGFAQMQRSDHSMLPPTPAATIKFKSPNACNLCHPNKGAQWADTRVREWRTRDYQAKVLHRSGLIEEARKRDWTQLLKILAYIKDKNNNEIYRTSLIRLLMNCDDKRKWPVIAGLLNDPSPLVRTGAVEVLSTYLTPENIKRLVSATGDEYRLVRVKAAAALGGVSDTLLKEEDRYSLEKATVEFCAAMQARPDDWASHYNLGNFYANRNELDKAIESYETAMKLAPKRLLPLVNVALVYSLKGNTDKAEESLRKALALEPENAAANFNLGLLLAEQNRLREAEEALRRALKADPQIASAAYNLGVILAQDSLEESIRFCQKAYELCPDEPKFAYTLAFYQHQIGDAVNPITLLQELMHRNPSYVDAPLLLGTIYQQQGKKKEAQEVYQNALSHEKLSIQDRYHLEMKLMELFVNVFHR